jgi:hypothetical protein
MLGNILALTLSTTLVWARYRELGAHRIVTLLQFLRSSSEIIAVAIHISQAYWGKYRDAFLSDHAAQWLDNCDNVFLRVDTL